jgi:choline-glycine betaine transporter
VVVVLVMLMVVLLVMMMVESQYGEGRTGKHHQQQGRGKNLFHDKNVAR